MAKRPLPPTSKVGASSTKKVKAEDDLLAVEKDTIAGSEPSTPMSVTTVGNPEQDAEKAESDTLSIAVRRKGHVVHHHSCRCVCGALTLDHTAFPHIVERILQHAPFRTLLAFRGTSRYYRDRIDDSLKHLVVTELPGAFPLGEMIIDIKTAQGYNVLRSLSSMCLGAHREDRVDKTASAVANYLCRKNGGREFTFPPPLLVDVYGEEQDNYGLRPHRQQSSHLLPEFLFEVSHIRQVRHLSRPSTYPSTVYVPRSAPCNLVILNDWLVPSRVVQIDRVGTTPTVIYRCNFSGGHEGKFVNTLIKGAKWIIYDFTECNASAAVDAAGNTQMAPIHYFIRQAAYYFLNHAFVIVVAGTPDPEWFDPAYAASRDRELKEKYPTILQWALHLLDEELELRPNRFSVTRKVLLLDSNSPDLKAYLPRSYFSVSDVTGPAMIVAEAAGKYVW